MQKSADNTNTGKFGHGSKAHKREQLIAALLVCSNHAEAAEQCGLSLSTVQRWLRDPAFAEEFKKAKDQLVTNTTMGLRAAGPEAVATLRKILRDDAAPPPARVSASRALLEFLYTSVQIEDLEKRLRTLEESSDANDF